MKADEKFAFFITVFLVPRGRFNKEYDAKLAQTFAEKMMENGVYVIGFFYPVVPKGKARIRVQLSAGHTREHLDKAIIKKKKVGKELGVIS